MNIECILVFSSISGVEDPTVTKSLLAQILDLGISSKILGKYNYEHSQIRKFYIFHEL